MAIALPQAFGLKAMFYNDSEKLHCFGEKNCKHISQSKGFPPYIEWNKYVSPLFDMQL